MRPHLTEEELERFLANSLKPAEQDRIGRHLQAGCGLCSRRLVEHAPDRFLQQAAEKGSRKASGIRSFRDQILAVAHDQNDRWETDEQALARSLDILRAKPQAYDAPTFRQVQDLQGQTLVKALLQRSFELRFVDAPRMRWLAYNAVKATEGLRPEEQEPADLFDLQGRAWAELGNAYRVNDQFAEAEAAFSRSRASLRKGTGDLHLLARAATLEASLRSAQRRLLESNELLRKVHRLYLNLSECHLAGRALISIGRNIHYGENPADALRLFREGLTLLDSNRDPQLVAVGQECLLHALVESGELHEAGRLLLRGGLRQTFAADPILLFKLRGVEGKLLAGLGKFARAEHALNGVREEFLRRGQHYEAAMVGLALVSVWLRQGNFGKVRATAKEVHATFRDLGIRTEAAKAQRYLN
jgi:tetratricopeptide (TPR) repeat protein